MQMAQVLGMRAEVTPWAMKKPVAVYRGSCYPTANPDEPGYLLLRGALCQEAARLQSPYIDVGMRPLWYVTQNTTWQHQVPA